MHLRPDELVDLAESTRDDSEAPHLRSCELCRGKLAELRTTMSIAAEVDVPEPSPLFWEHLSSRVRDAAAAEGVRTRFGWSFAARGRAWSVPLALAAALVLAIVVVSRGPVRESVPASPLRTESVAALESLPDDPALNLVADLAATMTYEEASEEIGAHAGGAESIDEAVNSLSLTERQELRRLLDEALRRPGD
jgi:hypothetical protein